MWTCSTCGASYSDKFGFCPTDGRPPVGTPAKATCACRTGKVCELHMQRRYGKLLPEMNDSDSTVDTSSSSATTQGVAVNTHKRLKAVVVPISKVEPRFRDSVMAETDESSGEAVVKRLSDGFKNLTTDEQMQAILSKKRKQAMLGEAETASAKTPSQDEKPTDSSEGMEAKA